MKTLLKFALLFACFAVLFVLPAILLPVKVAMSAQSEYNGLMFFILLMMQFSVICYLIARLNLHGMKLFLNVLVVFYGLQTFMPQTETWFFRDAMPAISNGELMNLFLRPLITAITFIPLAMWMLGKWKPDINRHVENVCTRQNAKEMVSLAVAYVVIYFLCGYFIAWQFEAVRVFYSGSPDDAGFIGGMTQNFQTRPLIFPFQLLRGLVWIVLGLPVVLYLKGTKNEKIVACALLYFLPALQLVVDNPFMPQAVRMAHLLEVATSNVLFGWLIGYASTRKIAAAEFKEHTRMGVQR